MLALLTNLLADALAPRGCAACDAPLAKHAVFCGPCASTVEAPLARAIRPDLGELDGWLDGILDGFFAGARYGAAVSRAITRWKYAGRPDLAVAMAHLVRHRLALDCTEPFAERALPRGTVLVPVPLHPARLAERGYNQAALLAAELRGPLGLRWCPRLLRRLRPTPRQAGLGAVARRVNVEGSIAVAGPLPGRCFTLVDDVCTTGSTLRACAAALRAAGAVEVCALVVAMAEPS